MKIIETIKPIQKLRKLSGETSSEETRTYFQGKLRHFMIPKGRVLVDIGQVSKSLYFIEKGAMRSYVLRGFEDITTLLVSDGDMICIAESFLQQKPSTEVLETLEDTHGISISYEAYRKLVTEDFQMAGLAIQLLEQHLITYSDRLKTFKRFTVEQRIAHYLNQPSSLFRRIPDHYIASYLGTTAATFSRCLKNINFDRPAATRSSNLA